MCHPHRTPAAGAGSLSIVGLLLFSVAFNICRFLEFETTYETEVGFEKLSPKKLVAGGTLNACRVDA